MIAWRQVASTKSMQGRGTTLILWTQETNLQLVVEGRVEGIERHGLRWVEVEAMSIHKG